MRRSKKLRVFHGLVNYGTQAGVFAQELRKNGIDAISVGTVDRFKRQIDVELFYGGNFAQRTLSKINNILRLLILFLKYNTFHFYYGTTLLPKQIDLIFYNLLGKKIVMEYLGNDIQLYNQSVQKYKWTNMTYLMNGEEGILYDRKIIKRLKFEDRFIDKAFVCAPVYSEFAPKASVLPLAIDLEKFQFSDMPSFNGTYNILHAPTHRGFKGTAFIEDAIMKLQKKGYKINLEIAEKVSHDMLLKKYRNCHIFIDQIIGGWYGTATIEAMATGRPVIVSIRNEYFKYIDYGEKIPALNADPDNIYEVLKTTLDLGYDYLVKLGSSSRFFVEDIHDVRIITKKLIKIYSDL